MTLLPMNHPLGGGRFGAFGGRFGKPWEFDPIQHTAASYAQAPEQEEKKRWLDGGKFGAKEGIALALGAIGDAFTGRPNTAQFLMHNMAQKKAAERAEQQRLQSIQDSRDQYMWQRDFDLKNPKPTAPDAFEKALMGGNIDPSSPQGQELYRRRAEAMARDPDDDFVVVPIPGRGTYAGPKSGLAAAMGQSVPTAPVGKLTPIGGSAPGGTGMFP